MTIFGTLHLTILGIIAALTVAAALLCRKSKRAFAGVRRVAGVFLAGNEIVWWIFRYAHEGIHLGNLPLQLCDLAVWLAVLACFSDKPLIFEAAYFPGLAGAAMALLTPDLAAAWPTYPAIYFFLAHGGIVITVVAVIHGARRRFSTQAIWRAWAMVLIYAAIVGTFDRIAGANYMYLMRKPEAASPLNVMGAWPWYIATGAMLALALFWLLWIPVRTHPFPDAEIP